ncbi:GNAT family N-acetyltransferase [Mesorhizobium muleiense]|uniref:GNAT family N-acetyltransferase n=1 Tax=Mesorhizobium muleiense TaxID=1004279 RepID=UPI0039AECAB0
MTAVFVDPDRQRFGFGQLLMQDLEERARKNGLRDPDLQFTPGDGAHRQDPRRATLDDVASRFPTLYERRARPVEQRTITVPDDTRAQNPARALDSERELANNRSCRC